MNSFCFPKSTSLRDVQQSLIVLMLPRDIVEPRNAENCLDIVTSTDRAKLFEKYLAKRYDFKREVEGSLPVQSECRLELRTTKKYKVDTSVYKLGSKNALSGSEVKNNNTSMMEMLIGSGIPSEFEAGAQKLKMTCQLIGSNSANLIFSYADKNAAASTQVLLKRGEWLNIATVKSDLNGLTKTIGIPQTEFSQSNGNIETIYELQFK